MADMHDSAPPRDALTAIEVAIHLDRLTREVKLMRIDLATAKTNDERFLEMERQFKALNGIVGSMKKYVGAAVLAALGGLGTMVMNKVTSRIPSAPAPASSSGASTFPDRADSKPDAGSR